MCSSLACGNCEHRRADPCKSQRYSIKIHQRGLQWKQGVVTCLVLYTILLYNTTPIHCTPLRLHPPVMNTHSSIPSCTSFKCTRTFWYYCLMCVLTSKHKQSLRKGVTSTEIHLHYKHLQEGMLKVLSLRILGLRLDRSLDGPPRASNHESELSPKSPKP